MYNVARFRFQPGFRVAERPDGPAGEDATLEALPRRLHLGAQGRPHRLRLPCLPPPRRTVDIRVAVRVRTDLCTEGGTRSDARFCHKFSCEFHWPVGHTAVAVQPSNKQPWLGNF